jgi:hypothetical protein
MITAPLIPALGWQTWLLVSVGYLSHLLLDMFGPEGIMLIWPISRTRYSIVRRYPALGGLAGSHGSTAEGRLTIALVLVVAVLFSLAHVSRSPSPQVASPSFEGSVAHYLGLRGRNLAFADVDGTWQASGRRVSARFEILNALGQSLVLYDRFGGSVFTAGRTNADNLYLNTLRVAAGSAVRVKPVEIELHDALLKDALPIVYQMQREPGLQHIFVSGRIVAEEFEPRDAIAPSPRVDYAQTQLQRVQKLGEGHYDLHYLTATDLIEMSNVPVEIASLVIVATYVSPPTGPTATPLPSPLPVSEVAP